MRPVAVPGSRPHRLTEPVIDTVEVAAIAVQIEIEQPGVRSRRGRRQMFVSSGGVPSGGGGAPAPPGGTAHDRPSVYAVIDSEP